MELGITVEVAVGSLEVVPGGIGGLFQSNPYGAVSLGPLGTETCHLPT